MLEWQRQSIELTEWSPHRVRSRTVNAQVSATATGALWVLWREGGNWVVGKARAREDVVNPTILESGMVTLRDAKLVAEVLEAGQGDVLRQHSWTVESWAESVFGQPDVWRAIYKCRCTEEAEIGGLDNTGEADAGARQHWREALQACLAVEPDA